MTPCMVMILEDIKVNWKFSPQLHIFATMAIWLVL